ncbi:transcription factor Adf-1-like [Bombina bombina]|uniref:transcription factor Adf-1-like n=1 Tax=Bombina bombina TaxID=8345 RepID=UPI00235A89C4|nr:transcription factor Adf-1-like [Bombina bombina]
MAFSQHCGWDADILFVLEVEKRPCLYDMRIKEYRNQNFRQMAWKEISEILNIPEAACPAKWKSIRDKYLRIYKKSGSGADVIIEDPTWIVSKYLSFLNPCLKPKRTTGNFSEFVLRETPQTSQSETSTQEDTYIESGTVQDMSETIIMETPSLDTYIELNPIVTDSAEIASQSSEMTDSATTSRDAVPGKRKRIQQSTIEKVLEALKAPIIVPSQQSNMESDADRLFLLSLLPDFRRINPRIKNNVKIEIIKLIDNAQEH